MLSRLHLNPRAAFWLVALASAWMCATLPVFSQEAYYWTYAQHPDLSYFDHPPMVAWLIWLGTHVFGDGAFGLRCGTWLCGLGTTWLGALLLRDFGVGARGETLWILLSVATPALAVVHFLANPDPALVFGWTGVMFAMWRARRGALGWWLAAGLAAGLAMLAKYSAAFLLPSGVALLLADPMLRRQLRRPGPYLAVVLASLVFLPVVVWNVQNDFESFRFQTGERFAKGEFGPKWLFEFVGGQALVVHPVLCVAIASSLAWLARRLRIDPRARWLLAFGLPLPAWFLANSLWIQVKLNWLAPACVPLVLGVVVWWVERGATAVRPALARAAAWTLLVVPAVVPFAPFLRLVPAGSGTSWSGWDEIAAHAEEWEDRLDPADGVEGNFFYFAADYRDAAQLGRNLLLLRRGEGPLEHPDVADMAFEPTMAQNVVGIRALQYDHWSRPLDRIGQDALFVLPRPERRGEMVDEARRHFASIARVERLEIRRLGLHQLDVDLYVCRGYKGPVVAD
ncbi:MAG: glycosyltransferase family 39 protein [Planctomycetes bacterium]|nr:glycosyltransferase family 39 protein [Planctomycetota bacterium]